MPLRTIPGDATLPQTKGPKILAHIVNDAGGWGKGFVLAVSKRWTHPERVYRNAHELILGEVQFVEVFSNLVVANMIAQKGFGNRGGPKKRLQEDKLELCLEKVAAKARELKASIHMPKIGTGLAGGKWEEIEPIIQRTMGDLDVTVYVM